MTDQICESLLNKYCSYELSKTELVNQLKEKQINEKEFNDYVYKVIETNSFYKKQGRNVVSLKPTYKNIFQNKKQVFLKTNKYLNKDFMKEMRLNISEKAVFKISSTISNEIEKEKIRSYGKTVFFLYDLKNLLQQDVFFKRLNQVCVRNGINSMKNQNELASLVSFLFQSCITQVKKIVDEDKNITEDQIMDKIFKLFPFLKVLYHNKIKKL